MGYEKEKYITHVREDFDCDGEGTLPPTKWANGSIEYLDWLSDSDIEVLMQFDYDGIDGFNTVVKCADQYFMMMSIDLE